MSAPKKSSAEGSLKTPERHPLDWKNPEFYNEESLFKELERVFDICHGCRRCFNLCQAFPTLFDAVDESDTMELDGVPKKVFWDVVDHCYLCDICFMTKCPYVPPHEWNVDFPHLMLRAKAVNFKKGETKFRDKFLTSTDRNGKLFSIPLVAQLVNTANKIGFARKMLESVLGIHADADLPAYHSDTLEKRAARRPNVDLTPEPTDMTTGKVALFGTCYGNYNEPGPGEDLMTVFEHNGIPVILARDVQCCGMPKLELGNLEAIQGARDANIPRLAKLVDEGWDLTALVPSCVLMFKQELPLFFPDDPEVHKVRDAFFDPFEYLALRHKVDKFKTDFKISLGKVAYHAACHQRVQNFGLKTRDILQLVTNTQIETIERCSGHDGTYAVKKEFFEASMKIVRPVAGRVKKVEPDHYGSDCPMAGHHVAQGVGDGSDAEHPITLLRKAYGI
jgi:Fe-S oxidoreductase